jgi:hypothetical protein
MQAISKARKCLYGSNFLSLMLIARFGVVAGVLDGAFRGE